jgi:phosphoglycolate phosphatase
MSRVNRAMDRPKSQSSAITESRPDPVFSGNYVAAPSKAHFGSVGPIRAILFDKDGTLVDFQRTWGPAVQAVILHLAGGNRAVCERLVAASGFIEAEQRFLPDSPLIGEPTSVYGALWAKALGRPANAALFAEIDQLLCDTTTLHLAAVGDPKTLLSALAARGYRLGMITNDAEITARAHARKLGLDKFLEFVAGYDSGHGAKPEPGPVLAFAQAVGVAPSETAVVGDTVLDLVAARAAGAIAIGVLTGPVPSAILAPYADALFNSPAEFAAWLGSR